ncbi:MAG: DUF6110 family protein [Methanosphaera sp.]|nr:DUF6110 family protein [Methanosphaera sp.]
MAKKGYTQRTRDFLGQEKVKYFVGGMVTAYVIKKVAETDAAHKAAVSLTAGALNIKDNIESGIENIKEDAEDIHEEAKEKQQIEIYGPEDVEEEEEKEDEE